jgi:hypothetical protein
MSLLANYDSDADSNEDADGGADDEDHNVAVELGVDAAHPGVGDGVVDVEANPMPADEAVEELDGDDADGANEAGVDHACRLSFMARLIVWLALSISGIVWLALVRLT